MHVITGWLLEQGFIIDVVIIKHIDRQLFSAYLIQLEYKVMPM